MNARPTTPRDRQAFSHSQAKKGQLASGTAGVGDPGPGGIPGEQDPALCPGSGAEPPSTRNLLGNAPQHRERTTVTPGKARAFPGVATKQKTPRGPRSPLARGAQLSWKAWRHATADALRSRGRFSLARAMRECGELAWSWDCASCGERNAAIAVRVFCDSRVCPQCARHSAELRQARVLPAVRRVPDMFRARLEAERLACQGRIERAERLVTYWDAARVRAGSLHALRRAERLRKRAAADLAREKWTLYRLRESAWGWRLITVSPPWRPWVASECSPERLRERAAGALARWDRLWERLSCGGAGAAVVSVELSALGHVHVHALVWSPFVTKGYLAQLAGCHVDVRLARPRPRDVRKYGADAAVLRALKECVKYALKGPGRGRREWVGGSPYRTAHPELAAAWAIATHGTQLARCVGLIRDALAAERAASVEPETLEEAPYEPPGCPCCGAPLATVQARAVPTDELARELGAREWRRRVRWIRTIPDRDRAGVSPAAAPCPLPLGSELSQELAQWEREASTNRTENHADIEARDRLRAAIDRAVSAAKRLAV